MKRPPKKLFVRWFGEASTIYVTDDLDQIVKPFHTYILKPAPKKRARGKR